jgi:hypothetical protein
LNDQSVAPVQIRLSRKSSALPALPVEGPDGNRKMNDKIITWAVANHFGEAIIGSVLGGVASSVTSVAAGLP